MTPRSRLLIVWLSIGALGAAIAVPLWAPLRTAWRCYWLEENAARERAEVLHKLDRETFALLVVEGPHQGQACTADTSAALFEATQTGDVLEVVYLDWKPGECELASTIEASARVLWIIAAALGAALLGLVALGAFLARSFTRPVHPARRMALEPPGACCPACGKAMDEGYLAVLSGIHWRPLGAPLGLPHALGGLPGTVGWRGRPSLHAFRCVPCEIVSFQYGGPSRRPGPGAATGPRWQRRTTIP